MLKTSLVEGHHNEIATLNLVCITKKAFEQNELLLTRFKTMT